LVAILAITFYLYIKISEKKLAIQDEAESMILDKIYEAIIQTDKNFVVTRWNRRAEHIFGWSAEEVIGKNIGDFVKGDDRDEWMDYIRIVKTHGSNFSDFTQLTKSGKKILIAISTSLLTNNKGKNNGTISVIRDITFRKNPKQNNIGLPAEIEDAIAQQLSESEEHNSTLSQINHDLQSSIEREKNEIAAKLFDELGQDLTSVKVTLSIIKEDLHNEDKSFQDLFKSSLDKIEEIFQSVKQLSVGLAPKIITDIGLFPAMLDYCNTFKKQTGIEVKYQVNIEETELEEPFKHFIFSTCRELSKQVTKARVSSILIEAHKENKIFFSINLKGRNFADPSYFDLLKEKSRQLGIRTAINVAATHTLITFIIPSGSQ
jgi:PAS domain S-box-containing protein